MDANLASFVTTLFNLYMIRFRHPNILEIMGYCFSPQLKALVYRYIENGSLHLWIHSVCFICALVIIIIFQIV